MLFLRTIPKLTFREVLDETPARTFGIPGPGEADFRYLKDAPTFENIEVFLDGSWILCERIDPPSEYKFDLSVVSFASEEEVGRAVQIALAELRKEMDTKLPWFKFSPKVKP
jgi:hypothetical protein